MSISNLKKFTTTTATVGALGAAALGLAGAASAGAVIPFGGSAADTSQSVGAQGYNVQLNGTPIVPATAANAPVVVDAGHGGGGHGGWGGGGHGGWGGAGHGGWRGGGWRGGGWGGGGWYDGGRGCWGDSPFFGGC